MSDRYLKEDPERAEAVLETLARKLDRFDPAGVIREILLEHKTFLMDVFRVVRGERD